MIYMILCEDKPDHLALRQETRPAHLAYLDTWNDRLKGAGPTLDADGQPNGSLILVEADDRAEVEAFAAADPYAQKGLFQSVTIRPWNWVRANPYTAE